MDSSGAPIIRGRGHPIL